MCAATRNQLSILKTVAIPEQRAVCHDYGRNRVFPLLLFGITHTLDICVRDAKHLPQMTHALTEIYAHLPESHSRAERPGARAEKKNTTE